MKRLFTLLLMIASASQLFAESEPRQVAAAVEAFHNALARGDAKAAINLLAPDAVILESGYKQFRAEYEKEHLTKDIKSAQTVPSTRFDVQVEVSGDTAWLTSGSRSEGSFERNAVNSEGVELVVLIRTPNGWRIRAIPWSSHKAR